MRPTKVQIILRICGCAGQFESYLVENPEDRFSGDMARRFSIPYYLLICPYKDIQLQRKTALLKSNTCNFLVKR